MAIDFYYFLDFLTPRISDISSHQMHEKQKRIFPASFSGRVVTESTSRRRLFGQLMFYFEMPLGFEMVELYYIGGRAFNSL